MPEPNQPIDLQESITQTGANPPIQEPRTPADQRRILMQLQMQLHTLSMTYNGPLPPPQILREYDTLVPGSAQRILEEADRQSHHRQKLESSVIDSDILNSRLGLIFAFILAMFVFFISYKAIMGGHSLAGTSLGGINVATLAGVFIYGSKKKSQELQKRRPDQNLPKIT